VAAEGESRPSTGCAGEFDTLRPCPLLEVRSNLVIQVDREVELGTFAEELSALSLREVVLWSLTFHPAPSSDDPIGKKETPETRARGGLTVTPERGSAPPLPAGDHDTAADRRSRRGSGGNVGAPSPASAVRRRGQALGAGSWEGNRLRPPWSISTALSEVSPLDDPRGVRSAKDVARDCLV